MRIFRRIVSVFLACLVLASSVGVIINQHICMGSVRSTAMFVQTAGCGMESNTAVASLMKGKGCCDEKTILIKTKASGALMSAITSVSPALPFHLIAIIVPLVYSISIAVPISVTSLSSRYRPPLIDFDTVVFIHSLLI